MTLTLSLLQLILSSMTGLVRLTLIILIVYFVFRVLVRYILPFALKSYLKKVQKRFFEQNPHLRDQPLKKEGEVSIENMPVNAKGKISEDTGEYVDYQEIND